MTELRAEVFIDRPVREVFRFISDPRNNPRWQRGMKQCEMVTDPPLGVGSQYDQVAGFAGRRIVSRFEIIEFVEDRVVMATAIRGSFPITFRRAVEPENGGTRVAARVTGNEEAFFTRAGPLVRWMAQRAVTKDYRRLKRLLESGAG